MCKAGKVETDESESIVKAILKREELGSTGIGRGVAVPHTKHPSVDRLVGTVAVSSQGVDFASLDGEVVHLFFLLVSPPDRPGDHLRALENISRQLRDDTFCRFLKQAKTRGGHPTTTERSRQQSVRIVTQPCRRPSLTRTVVVTDPAGVHARTAVAIAEAVRRGKSQVTLIKDERPVAGTDVLQIMTLVAAPGRDA